jgi:hypothetical protein
MNKENPMEGIEKCLQETEWKLAFVITSGLGITSSDEIEAAEKLRAWIHQPRGVFEIRGAALSLRALIDFECALASSEAHQNLLDANLLYAADAGLIPAKNRAAINEILGIRPQARQDNLKEAELWHAARPTDQSIYEWWWDQTPG